MTRPQIIRADTIDLQDRLTPSAQDHTRQPTHPAALGAGPPAPHQAETLREVAAEAEEDQRRSPRASGEWPDSDFNHKQQHYSNGVSYSDTSDSAAGKVNQQQDTLATARNGGCTGTEDADMADAEGDDGLEDDMMDKISSSPSIDDGGYSLPNGWLSNFESSVLTPKPSPIFSRVADGSSSSPFAERPDFYLLHSLLRQPREGPMESDPCYGPCSKGQGSEDDPSGDANTQYEDWSHEILGPVANGVVDDFLESYDDDFELSSTDDMFAVQTEVDLQSGFEDSYEGVVTIPYESSNDDEEGEEEDIIHSNDSRFVDSGWGGECLQELEDIDFEFVYALHTFVANVEGQANATKGDTMVLLDDSNSYWWLVRVVKDSSIGYLPAEHIETPTERLARLNKHRNIDLSATMLGDKDLGEKSKNPLKKAIRRRGTKTVTFSAPTYVEASDVDYSTDEEVDGDYGQEQQQQQQNISQTEAEEDEIEASPVATKAEAKEASHIAVENNERSNELSSKSSTDVTRNSDETSETKSEGVVKSRNGTVRNTDSFFKDDSVETRKITLTPNLLRDDSSTSTRTSNDSKEIRQRASLDKPERDLFSDKGNDRKRKKEKEKDKKPGMLSGFFKRGSKKSKPQEEENDEIVLGKKSNEESRVSPAPSKDSGDFVVEEQNQQPQLSPQREPSKLQKQSRPGGSVPNQLPETNPTGSQQLPASERARLVSATELSMRLVELESQTGAPIQNTQGVTEDRFRAGISLEEQQEDQRLGGALSKILRKGSSSLEPKPARVKKVKIRTELDDFDSTDDRSPIEGGKESVSKPPQQTLAAGAYSDRNVQKTANEIDNTTNERLSESPVQVSHIEASRVHPPPLIVDTSSQDEVPSPLSSPSPELVNADDIQEKKLSENIISTPTSTSTWSDSHLRTFFDEGDIKDLLVVVYDKSGVVPAGSDHPIIGNIFKEENAKLADITSRLDSMLGDWLARKMRIVEGRA